MNIVFGFIDGGEDQEEFVKEELMKLHYGHPTITGAQVNFCWDDQPGQLRTCQIDLTAYGQPFRVSQTGATFRDAANRALTTLTEKIEGHGAGVAAK